MYIRKPDYASVFCTVVFSLLLCAPFISESEAFSQRKFREQREAGISINTDEDLAAFGTVPGFSGSPENYGKVPDSSADLIFQSSPGLGRSIGEGGERRNIQPRRVSGFAIYNFAPDPSAATAYAATTVGPEVTVQDPFSLASSVTFADLVQRARQRNGFASPSSTQASTFEATTTTTLATSQAISQSTTHVPVAEGLIIQESSISRAASRYRGQPVQVVRSKKRPQLTSQQLQKIQKNANRFIRRQQRQRTTTTWTTTDTTSSTTTPLTSTETSQQPTTTPTTTTEITTTASTTAETTTMTSTSAETTTATSTTDTTTTEPTTLSTTVAPAPTTLSLPQLFTNFETVSARLVTRNVTSTSSVTDTPMPRESKMADDIITTTAPTRKQRQNDEGNSPTYDYYYSETTPTYDYYEESDTTNVPTVPLVLSTTPSPIVAFLLSSTTERQVVNIIAETTTSSVQSTTDTLPVQESQDTTFEMTSSSTSTTEEAVTSSMEAGTSSDRAPRTSDVEKWDKPEEQHLDGKEPDIFSGKYYEVNPGRYFEDNPGQYHEDNAGQYWEENPGQYYDPHLPKGQYHEKDPGQYRDQLDVQVVEVKYTDDAQVYNVQSKVDNFIIGEYGTISKSNGQTIQGVRYTAVDDQSIDPKLIYETLHKFFPMSQQQQQQTSEEEDEESAT